MWSSTDVQKQVGQTIVQLPHDRQRSATSSQLGMLGVVVEERRGCRWCPAAGPSAASSVVDHLRRPGPVALGGRPCAAASRTSAPRSDPALARNRCVTVEQLGEGQVEARVWRCGPVPMETQKQVPLGSEQTTVTRKASLRRAAYRASW